jgi:hypothetical protein
VPPETTTEPHQNGRIPAPGTSIRPDPIYVLGDSHAMEFNLRMYAGGDGRHYLFQSLYAPGLVAESCAGTDGELAPALATALSRAGLLVDVDGRREPLHRTQSPHWRHISVVEGRAPADPNIVVSIGGLDIVHFGVGLAHVDDLALPAPVVEPTGPLSGPPLPGAMPFDDAVDLFARQMAPLAQGLRDLQRLGFERLALLSLAPPTPHDGAFRAVRTALGLAATPSHGTLAFRTKFALVANTVLARIAAETGVTFIDRWNDQVRNGQALPGLLNDWQHLSNWAADATALAILERVRRAPVARAGAPTYYQVYVEDPGVSGRLREFTVSQADFEAINDARADAFVMLHDVNELSKCWVSRARIVRIAAG